YEGRSSQARPASARLDLGDAGLSVEVLEELVGGLLDRLVAPLGGTEEDGDDPGPMDAPEVAEDERVARLRVVRGTLGEPEVPGAVLGPVMRLQEAVLVDGSRLALAPVAPEHVPPRLDELAGVIQASLVHGIGGHRPSLDHPAGPAVKASSDGLAGGSRSGSRTRRRYFTASGCISMV